MSSKRKGFSLVEMMVVLVLMVILSFAAMMVVGDSLEKARMSTAMNDFAAISSAVQIAKTNGKTITLSDGLVNVSAALADAEDYLSCNLSSFPDEYEIVGNYLQYMEGGALKKFDFGDGRGEVDIKKKLQ